MKRAPTAEVYQSDDKWYWRLRGRNGEIVADGAEGYQSASNARRGFRTVQILMAQAQGDIDARE